MQAPHALGSKPKYTSQNKTTAIIILKASFSYLVHYASTNSLADPSTYVNSSLLSAESSYIMSRYNDIA